MENFADGVFFTRVSVGGKPAFVEQSEFHDIDSNSGRKAGWPRHLASGVCDPEGTFSSGPGTVESILSCAMPFYHRVYSPCGSNS